MEAKQKADGEKSREFKKLFFMERQRSKQLIEDRNCLQEQVLDLERHKKAQADMLANVSEEKKSLELRLNGLKKLQGTLDIQKVAKNHHRWSLRSAQAKKALHRTKSVPTPSQRTTNCENYDDFGSHAAIVDGSGRSARAQTAPSASDMRIKSQTSVRNKRQRPASEQHSRRSNLVDKWGWANQCPPSPRVMEWTLKMSQDLRSEYKVKQQREKRSISDGMWRVFFELRRDMNRNYAHF